ncbi:glycoside hydrolase family protein [Flavihumibacter sp. RY-1]|uniref:Glycoside hydrolase family protein n=1 Tax=Flavihumibacter fluminis TaxID=2909236 RepID=A0ABS9BNC7_9BACT|nr:glycoside hydrolase family protein [Flavihumibacter fluminis]MCF1716613.1 glycoside hydrolase family protein [Flavihumibacter fluminis]
MTLPFKQLHAYAVGRKTPSKKVFYLACIIYFLQLQSVQGQYLEVNPLPIDATILQVDSTVMLKGPAVLMDLQKMVWCGSVVKMDDSLYYMFYSTFNGGPDSLTFYNSWVLESEIAVASSATPTGNFKYLKTLLKGRRFLGDSAAWDAQMVHNPHVQKFNDTYYLYYVGSKDPGPQAIGSTGEKLSKRDRVQQSQQIGVIEFSSVKALLTDNFIRPDKPLLSPSTRVKSANVINPSPAGTIAGPDNMVVVNPSVVYRRADSKYLLYFKGNWYDPVWRGVHGVAIGDSPLGPFQVQPQIMFDIKDKNGKIANAEDPFVWYHPEHKLFYAVLKDFTGRLTGGEPSLALLQSQNGIKWELSPKPEFMKKQVLLKNGNNIQLYHLERPYLLLDTSGYPVVFYGAAAIKSPAKQIITGTFNVHIPLQRPKE